MNLSGLDPCIRQTPSGIDPDGLILMPAFMSTGLFCMPGFLIAVLLRRRKYPLRNRDIPHLSEEHFSLTQLRAARANPQVKSNSRTAVRAAPVISPPTWDLALILLLEKV